jgi:hypothetical protein
LRRLQIAHALSRPDWAGTPVSLTKPARYPQSGDENSSARN